MTTRPFRALRTLLLAGWLACPFPLPAGAEPAASGRPAADVATSLEEQTDVVVVGAGLAGLTAAYRLRQAGLEVVVLEASDHMGGRMRSASYPEGVGAEAGLEEFWNNNPTLSLLKELGITTEGAATAFSSFVHKSRLYPMEQETNEAFVAATLGAREHARFKAWDRKMQAAYARIEEAWRRNAPVPADLAPLQDVSFADWLKQKSGLSPLAIAMIRAESEPEYGTGADRISALDGIAEWHIFSGQGVGSRHVVGGNQKLAEALAERIGGDRVRTGHQVTRIAQDVAAGTVRVSALRTRDYAVRHVRARHVVTTMPLFRLYEVQIEPPLTPTIQQAIGTQTWGAYFTAHVVLDRKASRHWTRDGEVILPILSGGPLGVIYGGHDLKANPEHTMLNLLVTGDDAERFNARTGSLDDVRTEIAKALEKMWPGIGKDVRYMNFVRYHPRAIASWPVGRSRFDALSRAVREPQGRLYLAGDFTEGSHSDGAAWSAIRVVRQICAREGVQAPLMPGTGLKSE
ncbi:MAG: FAD-dependent oxidoreductase [Candidatus Sericytochromatia bacterium]|nr:FAD-dependent oxidoreductase [Candidatus Sericytochromatia bacterium]